jgi:type IV pilus assembly protein PilW
VVAVQKVIKRSTSRLHQAGVSLVELMIGLVIGMILVVAASSIYLFSKQSFNSSTETSQLEENGRFAINLLTKYIQSAGFVMVNPASPAPQVPVDSKISGCDFGLTNPTAPTSATDLVCLTATPTGARRSASLYVYTETDTYNGTGSSFQGFDCVGNSSTAITVTQGGVSTTTNQTKSYFFIGNTTVQTPNGTVSMGQLSCLSDTSTSSAGVQTYQVQPLMPGIEQLAFNYLLPSTIDPNTAQVSTTATALTTATWPSVLAVDVCVLAKSIQAGGNDTGTTYTDCYGSAITATAGEVYRTFRATVRLRNQTSS